MRIRRVSPSYLNLLEHNNTHSLLVCCCLGNSFDDLKDFCEDDAANLSTGMSEIFADPLLADEEVPRREIQDMITAAPGAAHGLISLFQAYRRVRRRWNLLLVMVALCKSVIQLKKIQHNLAKNQ